VFWVNFDPSGLVTFWFSEGQLLRPLVLLFFYFTKITYEREVTQIRNMLKIGERKGSKVYFRELKVESNQLIQRPRLRDEDSKHYEIEKRAQEAVCNLQRLTHDPSGNTGHQES